MIRSSILALALIAVEIAILAPPAAAQYMYLDSNGNGVHDTGDRMSRCGPTTIDVWLDTDSNRDGSLGTCEVGMGLLNMSHYEFVLHSVGGTITWGPMTNHIASFVNTLVRDSRDITHPTHYHNGWAGGNPQPPGLYRLATLTVTATLSPHIDIVVKHIINKLGRTSFGSDCAANPTYDHMKRFGTNWLDVDGLAAAAPTDQPPQVTAPSMVLPQDGTLVTLDVTASDSDADQIGTLTANLSALPPGHNGVFAVNGSNTAGTLTWTPTANDSGDYLVPFTATNCLSGSKTTIIRVIGTVTEVFESQGSPHYFDLAQNRPNPFNPATSIQFRLAGPGHVRLEVYDMAGRLRGMLINGVLPAGPHETRWLGQDALGRPVPSGVYWYRLESNGLSRARRMVLLR